MAWQVSFSLMDNCGCGEGRIVGASLNSSAFILLVCGGQLQW